MRHGIAELAALLRRGEATAEGLLDTCLEQIRAIDPELNSFVFVDAEGAKAAARASDARQRAGAARSPLDGIPLSIKDNLLVAGMPATWGSRSLADYVPERDELPVARLREAGAILVGKTNVPELTLEGYTRNDLFGVTRNPWDPRMTPGGSSGGAAAGVAAGLVAAAIGTDGGGSIRRPACHTGLVGWKPSIGRFAKVGGFPEILTDLETIGTLTHSVEDALILDAILAGPDPRDPRSLSPSPLARAPDLARILYFPRFGAYPVDPEVAEVTEQVARSLQESGHTVLREPLFFEIEDIARIWHVISRAGVAWLVAQSDGRIGKQLGASAQAMAEQGRAITGADYFDCLQRIAALRRRCAEVFATVDFILTPTVAALPWPAETPYPDRIAGREAGPRDHAIFTGWINCAGLPAINLPVGLSKTKLPIGVQLVSGFGADAALLAFAAKIAARYPAPACPPIDKE